MTDKNWQSKALGLKSDFQTTEIPDDAEIIILMTAANEFGDGVYCYLKIPFKHYAIIKNFLEQKEKFDPRDYGTIVAAGLGIPNDDVKEDIAREYGFLPINISEPEPIGDKFAFEDLDDEDDSYPF